MDVPALSIVVPTYNRCDSLRQTLSVILAQSGGDVRDPGLG